MFETLLRLQRTLNNARGLSSVPKNEPIPFLRSKARNYGVEDSYKVQGKLANIQRFGIPLGLSLFAIFVYLCYFKDYHNEGQSITSFITQDIREKFPEVKRFPQAPQEHTSQHKNSN